MLNEITRLNLNFITLFTIYVRLGLLIIYITCNLCSAARAEDMIM